MRLWEHLSSSRVTLATVSQVPSPKSHPGSSKGLEVDISDSVGDREGFLRNFSTHYSSGVWLGRQDDANLLLRATIIQMSG